jgi:hypothetical protein
VKETKRFNQIVSLSLEKITENSKMFDPKDDLKKFYEQLSEAQVQVQTYSEEWKDFEKNVTGLMTCLKSHNEFDVIDGNVLKSFLAENLVMNYSNIELHRVILQQKQGQNSNSFSQYAASSNNTLKKQLQMRVQNP